MFEDATFHSRGIQSGQTSRWMLLTAAINVALLAALIVLPLMYPNSLTSHLVHSVLYVPPSEPPAVIRHLAAQPAAASAGPAAVHPVTVPTRFPTQPPSTDEPPSSVPMNFAVRDIGVPSGTGPATGFFQRTIPTAVRPAASRAVTVSSGVSEGLLLSRTNPAYPVIARSAHVGGTVVMAATISTAGRIENLQVISGPVMLRQAAIDAVKTWRYRPYQLNGQPVEVETTINIVFKLGSE